MIKNVHVSESGKHHRPVIDPSVPTAFPIEGKANLMGDVPVRLCAEGQTLVAYGFGGQRIAIPASKIGTIQSYLVRNQEGKLTGSSLAILTTGGNPLLWVRGGWQPGLAEVRKALGVPVVTYPTRGDFPRYATRSSLPPETPVLRVRPRFWLASGFLSLIVALTMAALGAVAGALLSLLLPGGIGGVRDLIGIALAAAGVLGAIWLFFAAKSLLTDGLRWLVASLRAGGLAPWDRFMRLETPDRVLGVLVTVAIGLAIPFLLLWGPIIAIDSIEHGISDAALVGQLRQHGSAADGYVVNEPYYTTDSNGEQVEHDQAALVFSPQGKGQVEAIDPAIGGWTWPIRPDVAVTVVYDPADPTTAAVQGQITGSVWHGAPTGNIVAGGLALLAEVPLVWVFVVRVTAARRKAKKDFVEWLV
jgi:hypothetical protein